MKFELGIPHFCRDPQEAAKKKTPCSGDDLLREAVELLQIKEIANLNNKIQILEKESEEKEKQMEGLTKEKVEEITKITNAFENNLKQIKGDNEEEITRLTKAFENKLQQKDNEEIVLKEKLSGKTTLVNYLMIVLSKSKDMIQTRKDVIEKQAKEINEMQNKFGECQQRNDANLKIIFESQETVRKQRDNMARLQQVIKLDKNLTISYSNIAKHDIAKNNCNLSPWIESLAGALTEQKEKINELTLFVEDNDKIEEHLNNIKTDRLKINQTIIEEKCTMSPTYQELILKQSESISMLRSLMSYTVNSTSALRYEEAEDGTLLSASTCNCIPDPPNNSRLRPATIQYECIDGKNTRYNLNCVEGSCINEYWPTCEEEIIEEEIKKKFEEEGTWKLLNCEEVYVPYLNESVFCGIGGSKFGSVQREVGQGVFSQEVSLPCSECEAEMFEWSSWSMVTNKQVRWRGSKNVTNSYQEEERLGMYVIQKRGQFGNPEDYFVKNFDDYESGFGSTEKEFWIGLENLYNLTKEGTWELEVQYKTWSGEDFKAIFHSFKVGKGPRYELEIGEYDNDLSNTGGGVFLLNHNNQAFTTYDKDQDSHNTSNCSNMFGKGGWWYKKCYNSNFNGLNRNNNDGKCIRDGNSKCMKEAVLKMRRITQ